MKKVLLLETIDQAGMELMKGQVEIRLCPDLKFETIKREIAEVHGLIVRSFPVRKDLLSAAGRLEVIGRHGAGVDNIDVEYATGRGIAVVNTPLANGQSVAELVVTAILVLAKKAIPMDAAMRQGRLSDQSSSLPRLAEKMGFKGRELWRKTVGIIGLGRIGAKIANACHHAFEMRILAYDPFLKAPQPDLEFVSLVEELPLLLGESDFVVLQLPLSPQSRNLIGERELKMMKKSACLINAARGGIVNEEALARALEEGTIAGAAIDVFDQEPPPADHPFFRLPNTFVTPHVASITEESLQRMALELVEGVLDMLNNRRPRHLVNPSVVR